MLTAADVAKGLIRRCEAIRGFRGLPLHALRSVEKAMSTPSPWLSCLQLVEGMVARGGLVVLHGPRWTGKTVMAMALYCGALCQSKTARFTSQIPLLRTLRTWFNRQEEVDYEGTLGSKIDLLLIDESGVKVRGDELSHCDAALLTSLIDWRYSQELMTVFLSNESLAQITESMGPSIMRRIKESGQVIECNWPNFNQQTKERK